MHGYIFLTYALLVSCRGIFSYSKLQTVSCVADRLCECSSYSPASWAPVVQSASNYVHLVKLNPIYHNRYEKSRKFPFWTWSCL